MFPDAVDVTFSSTVSVPLVVRTSMSPVPDDTPIVPASIPPIVRLSASVTKTPPVPPTASRRDNVVSIGSATVPTPPSAVRIALPAVRLFAAALPSAIAPPLAVTAIRPPAAPEVVPAEITPRVASPVPPPPVLTVMLTAAAVSFVVVMSPPWVNVSVPAPSWLASTVTVDCTEIASVVTASSPSIINDAGVPESLIGPTLTFPSPEASVSLASRWFVPAAPERSINVTLVLRFRSPFSAVRLTL